MNQAQQPEQPARSEHKVRRSSFRNKVTRAVGVAAFAAGAVGGVVGAGHTEASASTVPQTSATSTAQAPKVTTNKCIAPGLTGNCPTNVGPINEQLFWDKNTPPNQDDKNNGDFFGLTYPGLKASSGFPAAGEWGFGPNAEKDDCVFRGIKVVTEDAQGNEIITPYAGYPSSSYKAFEDKLAPGQDVISMEVDGYCKTPNKFNIENLGQVTPISTRIPGQANFTGFVPEGKLKESFVGTKFVGMSGSIDEANPAGGTVDVSWSAQKQPNGEVAGNITVTEADGNYSGATDMKKQEIFTHPTISRSNTTGYVVFEATNKSGTAVVKVGSEGLKGAQGIQGI
jgi:hypothetical protein